MKLINKKNLIFFSVLIFLIIFFVVYHIKPAFLFNQDGSIKFFGLGYKNKTIIPLWLFTLSLSIFSYITIFYLTSINIVY